MKFYFCESCGKRITDADLDSGQGKDKKLKGVFCKSCAVGVMTMETLPLDEEQAKRVLERPPGRRTPAGVPIVQRPDPVPPSSAVHRVPKRMPVEEPPPSAKPPLGLYVGGGLLAFVVLLPAGCGSHFGAGDGTTRDCGRALCVGGGVTGRLDGNLHIGGGIITGGTGAIGGGMKGAIAAIKTISQIIAQSRTPRLRR